ncbi:MAG: PKD domain-containing protein [gamma proteobacterium endosymbiont of Lamellibrachia anaximandri]|nr:PKD domain-containing protein [gamma proteobacterium endosymbiont of Lamellibrachia anaximandri]
MANTDNRGYVRQAMGGLMSQGAASAKSKFLSLARYLAALTVVTFGVLTIIASSDEPAFEKLPLNVVVDENWVFLMEGDTVSVRVDTTTNNPQGRTLPTGIKYVIEPVDRYDGGTLAQNLNAGYSFDYGVRTQDSPRAALLTIETQETTRPGIYLHDISIKDVDRFAANFEQNTVARLGLVVVPTGGAVKTSKVTRVAAGLGHSLALLEDGAVWAWGDNQHGQLGDDTLIDRNLPVPVQGLEGPMRDIAAGDNHSLALSEDGRVYTWGASDRLQLSVSWDFITAPGCPEGRFDIDDREFTFSIARPVFSHWTAGEIELCDTVPNPLEDVVAIAAGDAHSLALQSGGPVISWGGNAYGQLGRDSLQFDRQSVDPVESLPDTPIAVSAGTEFSLALLNDGTVWGWGRNNVRQLGANTPVDHLIPVQIPFISSVQQIHAGDDYTVALVSGEPGFRGWGANSFGQLGDGTIDTRYQPVQTAAHLSIAGLAAGYGHTLASLVDGQVWTWGDNAFGQMAGAALQLPQSYPVHVPGLDSVSSVAVGGFHSLASHNACGNVWSWGRNYFGQLGHGTALQTQETPLQVYGLGEAGIGAGCEVVLRVYQTTGGQVMSAPSGFEPPGCEGLCAAGFVVDAAVSLTASSADGFEFTGWRGDCAGEAEAIQLIMNESKNCFADYRPVASFTFEPASPQAGQEVIFEAGELRNATVIGYLWDFGDGSPPEATDDATAAHIYANAGDYDVLLRITYDGTQTIEATRSVTVAAAALMVPQNVQTSAGDGQVTVSWDSVSGATLYNLYWNTTGNVNTADNLIGGVSSSYDHTGLTNGIPYHYIVTAIGPIGESTPSSEVSAVPATGVTFELSVQATGISGASGSVTSDPAGIDCNTPDTCLYGFAKGTVVRLTALPAELNFFEGWGGNDSCDSTGVDGSGNDYCDITISQDMSIIAMFFGP